MILFSKQMSVENGLGRILRALIAIEPEVT